MAQLAQEVAEMLGERIEDEDLDGRTEAVDALTPEERHRFYKMLGLKVIVGPDGSLKIGGAFIVDGPLEVGEAVDSWKFASPRIKTRSS
jgi:hypothetical protein